ncbi:hypothetical protein [Pseudomonas putida]|uniref:hypothetical protein n=1 Tax=Pseudomonas putida TaxID=303 RepID=UPI0015BE20B3|nr:hypothetical protein [Pseudomonas putida]
MIGIGIAPSGLEKLDGEILANRADQCSLAKMMLVIGFGYKKSSACELQAISPKRQEKAAAPLTALSCRLKLAA